MSESAPDFPVPDVSPDVSFHAVPPIEAHRNGSHGAVNQPPDDEDIFDLPVEEVPALSVLPVPPILPALEIVPPAAAEETTEETTKPIAGFPCTEVANADRLIYYHGRDLRYCYQAASWLAWEGTHWGMDETGEIDRRMEHVTRQICHEAGIEENAPRREAILKWALQSMSNKVIKGSIERARSKAPVKIEAFDQHPFLLNCQNGTLNLTTGRMAPHNRDELLSKVTPLVYDPEAACPLWEKFLRRILDNNQELIDFIQRAIGYSLTGSTKEQVIFILHGSGSNGKTTFLETIKSMLTAYAKQTPPETLMIKKNQGPSNDVAALRGARFVCSVETNEGQRLSEVQIKQLSGGDTVTCRFLFKEFFDYTPEYKLFLATNHRPVIRGTDLAIWRRIRLIPFNVTIADSEKDRELPAKLREELPGILTWAVRGCLSWQQESLGLPAEVAAATAGYRSEMDTIASFFDDRCVMEREAMIAPTMLYESYKDWCRQTGEEAITQRMLAKRLEERGFTSYRTDTSRYWQGLRLQARDSEDAGPPQREFEM